MSSPTRRPKLCKEELSDSSDDESDIHQIFNNECISQIVDTENWQFKKNKQKLNIMHLYKIRTGVFPTNPENIPNDQILDKLKYFQKHFGKKGDTQIPATDQLDFLRDKHDYSQLYLKKNEHKDDSEVYSPTVNRCLSNISNNESPLNKGGRRIVNPIPIQTSIQQQLYQQYQKTNFESSSEDFYKMANNGGLTSPRKKNNSNTPGSGQNQFIIKKNPSNYQSHHRSNSDVPYSLLNGQNQNPNIYQNNITPKQNQETQMRKTANQIRISSPMKKNTYIQQAKMQSLGNLDFQNNNINNNNTAQNSPRKTKTYFNNSKISNYTNNSKILSSGNLDEDASPIKKSMFGPGKGREITSPTKLTMQQRVMLKSGENFNTSTFGRNLQKSSNGSSQSTIKLNKLPNLSLQSSPMKNKTQQRFQQTSTQFKSSMSPMKKPKRILNRNSNLNSVNNSVLDGNNDNGVSVYS